MADKLLWGCVDADGAVRSGSGFTVSRSAVGTYRITYDTAFTALPAVLLTQGDKLWGDFGRGGGDTRAGCRLVAGDATQCKLVTGDEFGVHVNRNFCFLVIGPQ